jgi:glycerophosphoryl diester phosphodiesterase
MPDARKSIVRRHPQSIAKAIKLGCAAALLFVSSMTVAQPLVIAHRGASGERPEHTLAAYELAIAQGADYVEVDLVVTKDGALIARHENEISGTTDVADRPEVARRRATKTIDGHRITGWFSEDFTLAELRQLRARERLPQLRPDNVRYDGQFSVPTLQEIIDLVRLQEVTTTRRVGLYIEIKHSSYFRALGLPVEEPLVATLERSGFRQRSDHVYLQSFEVGNLQRLRRMTEIKLVQLLAADGGPADRPAARYAAMATPAGLADIALYADGIGPEKSMIIDFASPAGPAIPTALVTDAHAAGLTVHPWTFRSENHFLPLPMRRGTNPAGRGDAVAEYMAFLEADIDGVFSDHPEDALAAVEVFLGSSGNRAAP